MPESHPIALSFEVTETRGGPSESNRGTITSVERDDSVIHVNYEIVPPPDVGSHRARAEAKDDLGNDYGTLGSHFGITANRGSNDSAHGGNRRALGRLTMPLPPPPATTLRIRITWNASYVVRMPLGRARPIDLGATSARSPRLASRLIGFQHSSQRR
jgi:hypothetical protein